MAAAASRPAVLSRAATEPGCTDGEILAPVFAAAGGDRNCGRGGDGKAPFSGAPPYGVFAGVAHVDTVRASEGLLRLRRGGLARISGEMTPPSSSRGVGGAERVRRNCCRPRRAKQWKQRTAFARLRGVQQQRRSTGAGRGRSSSSSIGSMFRVRARARGERFIGVGKLA